MKSLHCGRGSMCLSKFNYICLDCGLEFDQPVLYYDILEEDIPHRKYWGCPYCEGEAFTKALYCEECGALIQGSYVRLKNMDVYCEKCFTIYEIGDEDV